MRVALCLLLAALPVSALDEEIGANVRLPPGPLRIERPLRVAADGITVDLDEAVLGGAADGTDPDRFDGIGILIDGRKDVTIRGGHLRGFRCAILARGCEGLVLEGIDVSGNFAQRLRSTPDREFEGDWLWPHENDDQQWRKNYGAGICLETCFRATVRECTGRNQQNGLLLDRCEACKVYDNDFSFNSGWGIAMWRSCENLISRNKCDWCVRGYSHGVYDRGQDSAGILVFEQCSRNVFVMNSATHSGDGFFLYAGHETTQRTGEGGCNDNLVKGNDFSHAVANAIEATFSCGNEFVENRCDDSNYGIWAGYSYQCRIKRNRIHDNSVAGIAIEHGSYHRIEQNDFARNPRGIWLWWDDDKDLLEGPFGRKQGCDSRSCLIKDNRFDGDRTAVLLERTFDWVEIGNKFHDVAREVEADRPGQRGQMAVSWPVRPPGLPEWMPRDAGRRAPFLPDGHPRGRKHILIGEWGPLDPTQPGVYPSEGGPVFRVIGTDDYEVTVSDGLPVEKDGRTFRVKAGPGLHEFAGEVRIGEKRFPFKGRLFNATWTISHWKWDKDPRDEGAWAALMKTKPLTVAGSDRLDCVWGGGGPKDVAADRFATRAETKVTLPKGRYELTTLSDDGVRVLVDGRVAQEDWTWHGPKENATLVDLDAGEHEIIVEHFEIDGYAVLRFGLKPSR